MSKVVLVGGTWSYDGTVDTNEWYSPHSEFVKQVLTPAGIEPLWQDDPYVWDGEVSGAGWWSREKKHLVWRAAAANLVTRLKHEAFEDRNLLVHSHGTQVFLYAASVLPLNRVIDVAGPVRQDMAGVILKARPHIASWWHLYSTGWMRDKMQWFGEFFDGAWNIPPKRTFDQADKNVACQDVGHSGLLCEQKYFSQWGTTGAAKFLSGGL